MNCSNLSNTAAWPSSPNTLSESMIYMVLHHYVVQQQWPLSRSQPGWILYHWPCILYPCHQTYWWTDEWLQHLINLYLQTLEFRCTLKFFCVLRFLCVLIIGRKAKTMSSDTVTISKFAPKFGFDPHHSSKLSGHTCVIIISNSCGSQSPHLSYWRPLLDPQRLLLSSLWSFLGVTIDSHHFIKASIRVSNGEPIMLRQLFHSGDEPWCKWKLCSVISLDNFACVKTIKIVSSLHVFNGSYCKSCQSVAFDWIIIGQGGNFWNAKVL